MTLYRNMCVCGEEELRGRPLMIGGGENNGCISFFLAEAFLIFFPHGGLFTFFFPGGWPLRFFFPGEWPSKFFFLDFLCPPPPDH